MTQLNFLGEQDKPSDDNHLRAMAERIWNAFPRKAGKEYGLQKTIAAIRRLAKSRSWDEGAAGRWIYLQVVAYSEHPETLATIESDEKRHKENPAHNRRKHIPHCSTFMTKIEERDWCEEVRQFKARNERRARRSEIEQQRRDADIEQAERDHRAETRKLQLWRDEYTDEEWAEMVQEARLGSSPDHPMWAGIDSGEIGQDEPRFISFVKRRTNK